MGTVWVNGCFDILHDGHLQLLQYASKQGERLIVGIDSDYRIKSSKGEFRPINNQNFRKAILELFCIVDKVYVFDTDFQLEQYIKQSEPSVMVVGSEYKGKNVIGSQFVEKVIFFQKVQGYSTTSIIDKIQSNAKANKK